jgi:hypothetical protein
MRHLSCGIILAILSVGVLFVVSLQYLWAGLDMSLYKPTRNGTNPVGEFRLEHRLFGFDSEGRGGACLIADIAALLPDGNDHKKAGEIHEGPCTAPAQCNPLHKEPSELKPGETDPQLWEGYCVPIGQNQRVSDSQPGRCWYRPADNDPTKALLCHTSGHKGGPWPVGVNQNVPFKPGFDLADFYQKHTSGKPAQWRLSGRLDGTQPNAVRRKYGDPACLSPDPKKKC